MHVQTDVSAAQGVNSPIHPSRQAVPITTCTTLLQIYWDVARSLELMDSSVGKNVQRMVVTRFFIL